MEEIREKTEAEFDVAPSLDATPPLTAAPLKEPPHEPARTVRQRCPADRLGPQPLRQTDGRDPRIPDRPGRHGGDRQRRDRAGPDRRNLPRPVQLRHDAAGVPVLAGPAGLRAAGQRPVHPGRERLRLRIGRVPAGHQVAAGRYREDRPRDRRRKDDPCGRRRRGRGPARRRLRHGRQGLQHRLHRALRRGRQALREALRRWRREPVGCPGHHRREEPPQRRGQPLRPAPQGPRRGVLPHRLGQEPDGRRPAAPHRLLARVRRRRRRRADRRADRRGHCAGAARRLRPRERLLPRRAPRTPPPSTATPRLLAARAGDGRRRARGAWTSPRCTTASPSPNC